MSEYIDREKIMLKTCSDCTRQVNLVCKHPEPCGKLISAFLCEEQEMLHYQCSVCGEWCSQTQELYEYCPHCGARMDG